MHGSTDEGASTTLESGRPSTESANAPAELNIDIFHFSSKRAFTLAHLKYLTFTMIGISLLWPWNCFLTASAYYADRFVGSPSLVRVYLSTMMSISTITSTVYNYYLSQLQTGVDYTHRVNLGLLLTIGVFVAMAASCVATVFLDMKDTAFFIGLMLMVFLLAVATCLAQNGTMAIANVMGGIYANAVMVGQAIAGVLPSVALIASILIAGPHLGSPANRDTPHDGYNLEAATANYGVFIYYITASLVSFVSMTLLYWTNFYKAETAYEALTNTLENGDNDTPANSVSILDAYGTDSVTQSTHVPFSQLWRKLKLIVLAIFLTFSITLIFPVFASNVESVHTDSKHRFFLKAIFVPFIYLVWNLGDLLGRVLCGFLPGFVIHSPRQLVIYSLLRLVFIPLFFTCNIHPYTASGQLLALINLDLWYILLQFLFGLLNGQLCTSSFMIVRDYCDDDDEKEAAGGFTTVFLSVGLAFGSVLSYLLVAAIN